MSDNDQDVVNLLTSIEAHQKKLVDESGKNSRKTFAERLATVAGIITPLLIAAGGWIVTARIEKLKVEDQQIARTQAAENKNLEVVLTFLPFLMGDDEEKKKFAIHAIRELGNPKLAAFASALNPSVGSAQALSEIAVSPGLTTEERQDVQQALGSFPDSIRAQLVPVSDSTRRIGPMLRRVLGSGEAQDSPSTLRPGVDSVRSGARADSPHRAADRRVP